MAERYDIVLYGASGFTGAYVLEALVNYDGAKITYAIAGRNKTRLHKTLVQVSEWTGKDLSGTPIIVADSGDEAQLVEMVKQAKVVVNVVGPYRLYGEAVVKAAIENGASHVDIAGEPAFLESMQQKYGETAKRNGVYVVGACGFDSIPCDLGVNWVKQNFDGTVSHVETFVQMRQGPAGYSFNAGTYQTLLLGLWQAKNDGLGKIRKTIMPEKLPKSKFRPPRRGTIWWNETLQSYCVPFVGADKSVVQRSQYHDTTVNSAYPVAIETYIAVKSLFWAVLAVTWLFVVNYAVKYKFTRSIFQKYTGVCSGGMFKDSGPTREQAKQASFTYWFIVYGWPQGAGPSETEAPKKTAVARCDGPDAGYIGTAGCILSSALTILQDKTALPEGGVYSTAAIFKNTKIYERLASFNVTFRFDDTMKVKGITGECD